MSGARATPPDKADQQQHTPTAIQWNTRGETDTIHCLTSHCSRSYNQRMIAINDDQQSSFND